MANFHFSLGGGLGVNSAQKGGQESKNVGINLGSVVKNAVDEVTDVSQNLINIIAGGSVKSSSSDNVSVQVPYPELPALPNTYKTFSLGHGGIPESERKTAIAAATKYHESLKSNVLGSPVNFKLDFQEFSSYMDIPVFNTGDPFTENNSVINSKFMERAVLDYYAELWNAKWPHDENDGESYWGYITPMGGSEANIYALWNARDYLSGKLSAAEAEIFKHVAENPNTYNPVLFITGDKHYSFPKAGALLGLGTVIEIPVDATGAVRIEDLTKAAEFYASQGHPMIICFNYGSTVNGAYDDVAGACEALKPILEKYNLFERDLVYENEAGEIKKTIRRAGYWVHVDGAFGSSYMPFIEMAHSRGMIGAKGPTFDFRLPMVSSISSSEQKFTGVPIPTGILMSKVKFQIIADSPPEYIGGRPTLSGTRNGLAPMLLWNSIARNSYDDKIKKALAIQETAEYMEKKLRNLQDIDVKRNPLSLTLRFKCPNNDICKKYSLWADNVNGSFYTNVFAMEHVSKELIDALFEDLSAPDAFER